MAAVISLGDVHQGQGAVLRQPLRGDGDRGAAARRQLLRPRLRRRRATIRFGLDAVKNVGHAAVETIIDAREAGGPFASIWDFCERVDARAVNKRAIECLVKCGALDSTGATRKGMLEALAQAQSAGQKAQEDSRCGQGSIFDLGGGDRGRSGPRRRGPQHPPIARRGVRPARAARGWRRRRSARSCPPTR